MIDASSRRGTQLLFYRVASSVALGFRREVITRVKIMQVNSFYGGQRANSRWSSWGNLEDFLVDFFRGFLTGSTLFEDWISGLFVMGNGTWIVHWFFACFFSTTTRLTSRVSGVISIRDMAL